VGFPPDGVVERGTLNQPGWVYATVDIERVNTVRQKGQVLNVQHWPESIGLSGQAATQNQSTTDGMPTRVSVR
jgi:hypothetical protein